MPYYGITQPANRQVWYYRLYPAEAGTQFIDPGGCKAELTYGSAVKVCGLVPKTAYSSGRRDKHNRPR